MADRLFRNCSWCGHKGIIGHDACPHCTEWIQSLPDVSTMGLEARIEELEDWGSDAKAVCEVEFHYISDRITALMGRGVYTQEMGSLGLPYLIAELKGQVRRPETMEDTFRGYPQDIKDKFIPLDLSGGDSTPSDN